MMERRRRIFMWVCVLLQSLVVVSLNDERIVLLRFKERIEKDPFGGLLSWEESLENDHCSWFGVECVDGHVVSLNLKSLCLAGALGPELAHLVHIKSIILRNNSLFGVIPEELGSLKDLQLLDLSFNNFSAPLLLECWGNDIAMIMLDNNGRFCRVPPESCVAERATALSRAFTRDPSENSLNHRRLQQTDNEQDSEASIDVPPTPFFPVSTPGAQAESPLPSPASPESPDSASVKKQPPAPPRAPPPSPTRPTAGSSNSSPAKNKAAVPVAASVGGFILAVLVGLFFWRCKKMAAVGPWRGGLSGELQRSSQNGIPNVKRRELEIACEDFSNVIGSTSTGTLYKGTLSNGAEIAVLSYTAKSSKYWSKDLQTQFSNKVEKLSKVNHKNFLNLLAYCKEEKPFTRMLIFEYAPCGTLFEHLHVRESEHLDWAMRLRIMMGIAYSLEHMHNLSPWVAHENLTAYAVSLTDDYAAKISDSSIWNEVALAAGPQPTMVHGSEPRGTRPEDNVCSFGLILLEMVTGKTPYSVENGSLEEWALQCLRGEKPLNDFVDPMLSHFDVAQLERVGDVIKSCTYHDPYKRPGIADVASRLGEITGVAAGEAAPRNCMWLPAFEFQSSRL